MIVPVQCITGLYWYLAREGESKSYQGDLCIQTMATHTHPPTTFPQRPMTHPVAATKFWATTPSVYVCVIAKKEIICALRLSLRYIDGKTSCVKGCVNSMLPFSCFLILHRKRWKRMSLATSDTTILNIRVSQSIGPSSRSASCCSFLLLFVLLPDKTRNISLSISSRLQMLHARGRNEISSNIWIWLLSKREADAGRQLKTGCTP